MVKGFKSEIGKKLIYESYDKLLSMWGVDFIERDVVTSYGSTHVILSGNPENPPLLLFHGVGDNSALMWVYNAKDICRNFYLIAVDTMGGPGKSNPSEGYGKGFSQTAWMEEVLDALNIEKTYIAGVSNGAYLAQLFTAKRPERVYKAVCMAGSVAVKSRGGSALWRMMKLFLPEALFPTEKNVRKLLRKMCGINYRAFEDNALLMEHWYYLLKYNNPQAMMFHKIEPLNAKEIDILRQKVLFIIGDHDKLSYHTQSMENMKTYQLTYKIIKGAGHGINHESPEIFGEIIIPFFTE